MQMVAEGVCVLVGDVGGERFGFSPEFPRQDRLERKDKPKPFIIPYRLSPNVRDPPRSGFEKSLARLVRLRRICALCVRTATFELK